MRYSLYFLCFMFSVPAISTSLEEIILENTVSSLEESVNDTAFKTGQQHLINALPLLQLAARYDYAPAQKILALVSQSYEETRNFLKEYNKNEDQEQSMATTPISGHSQSFPQQARNARIKTQNFFKKYDPSLQGIHETDFKWFEGDSSWFKTLPRNIQGSAFFFYALEYLTEYFELIDALTQRSYEPAKQSKIKFSKQITGTLKKSDLPIFQFSKELDQRCEAAFECTGCPK